MSGRRHLLGHSLEGEVAGGHRRVEKRGRLHEIEWSPKSSSSPAAFFYRGHSKSSWCAV